MIYMEFALEYFCCLHGKLPAITQVTYHPEGRERYTLYNDTILYKVHQVNIIKTTTTKNVH